MAPYALLYVAVTRPLLVLSLGGWVAEQLGLNRSVGIFACLLRGDASGAKIIGGTYKVLASIGEIVKKSVPAVGVGLAFQLSALKSARVSGRLMRIYHRHGALR
jgi:hypothetical protein